MRVHLVHVRDGLTLREAVNEPDGTAILAIFFALGLNGNALSSISPALDKIVLAGNQTTLSEFRPRPLLPPDTDAFYRYEGSVPTPNCDEAVIWTVFGEPNEITQAQVYKFLEVRMGEKLQSIYNTTVVYRSPLEPAPAMIEQN
ncbi:hypothetical protein COOONC_18146 [Cooperia oncophora]